MQKINIFTDHKNLVHESELKTSQRVMRWRLLLEEYGPEIVYIKGHKNVVADALSRLPKQGDIVDDVDAVLPFVPVDPTVFPVNLRTIQEQQVSDRSLRRRLKTNPKDYSKLKVEQTQVIVYKNRIYIPNGLCSKVLDWYHHYLCHPGKTRMYKTIASTMYWERTWRKTWQPLLRHALHVRDSRRRGRNMFNYHPRRYP